MNPAPGDNLNALCEGYRREAELYTRALGIADELLLALGQGQDPAEPSRRLAGVLDEVAAVESRLAEPKRRGRAGGARTDPRLQSVLAEVTAQVAQLLERTRQAEQEAAARHACLLPELDVAARARHMRSAYGRSGR